MKNKLVLGIIIAVLLVPMVFVSAEEKKKKAAKTLNLLLWEGYAEPEWKGPFEQDNKCNVTTTYSGSDDELFAKLKAGGGRVYDMVATNRANLKTLVASDLILPLDEKKIPNYALVFDAFKGNLTRVNGKLYSTPFVWGTLPLEINADKVKGTVDSWGILWDEKYKGRVSMVEDASASISTAALYLGIEDPYNLSDAQFEQVKQALVKQKPLIRTYTTGFGEMANAFAAGEIVAGLSQGEYLHKMLLDQKINAKQVIPKEGALGWIDTWAMVKGTKNQDLAYKWINHVLGITAQKTVMEKLNYGGVSKELPGVISNDVKALFNMFDEKTMKDYFDKLVLMDTPESWDKRIKLWNEVKGGVE
jgi:putative spermidine/putrescine transport system substrate-binding protein/spermidine/putrescine transport system substrate-binding protein